ncbi:hypothetical protein DLD77_05390 [Chitinophaga alhagiae]|uniref:DUF1905 domain-containing protein n=1 Tax=Chitinophaga alhagiae TaxID=2203219 RepID=A0ABM6WAY2_9BACT|nr:YdeI/OmpD-associated family protein [Chitinophaga alhagiae]AWO01163.1 hypothetical protein DLD77_05390 [Chitinophaga alhagiae]
MIKFTAILKKFDSQGEKTGWTYLEVPANLAAKLKPGTKKSFRVKGLLDAYPIHQTSLVPMGEGDYILAVNAAMRKGIGKRQGASVKVQLEEDKVAYQMDTDFMACLLEEPQAQAFFNTLPPSHQRYFSKWIDSAKTEETRAKRIALSINGLAKKMGYGEMIRAQKAAKDKF